jgi:hypothetical protein
VNQVSGPLYGSPVTAVLSEVVCLGLLFGILTILEGKSLVQLVEGIIGVTLGFTVMLRLSTVEVDNVGVKTHFPFGGGDSIPWSDIEAMEGHRFSARLLRRSDGKRRYIQMLDPKWSSRPVSRAIRAHLATAAHKRTLQS